MGGFLIAWLVGMGLSISHEAYSYKVTSGTGANVTDTLHSPLPPKPGRLLIASGIYVGLAILAEAPSMNGTATLLAWGYNVAIALKWAQEYSNEKNTGIKAGGTSFWNPPTASGNSLFPTGGGNTPATSTSSTTSGNTSGGPMVA